MSKVKGLEDVKMRYRPGRPEVWVEVDPVRAAVSGMSAESVAETAHALMRGLRATTFRSGGQQIETIVRLRAPDREDLAALPDLPLFNGRSSQLRLGNVARLRLIKMPNEISRRNRQRFIEVTANRAGISLGAAAGRVQGILDGLKFPLDYYASLDGDYQEMARGFRQLSWGVAVMVLAVYLVLVLLFESLLQPLVIMTTVPLCVAGAAWGLVLFRTPVTTGVLVGVMMLGGIVVNNALMLLDRFNADPPPPGDAAALAESLFMAAHDRMRPIFLTAASGVLDFLPMMLDASESGALWRPLSITMVFGLLVSTVLTLYVVPCVAYVLAEDLPRALSKGAGRSALYDSFTNT
jgi:HAE1 family hydrophobic/amphiphilic exporter-1